MFDISMMELKHESSAGEQPFVLWAAMVTVKAKELLIPAAGCFHVAYGDHGLGLSCPNRDHDTDAVAGRVVDLDKPTLTAVELGSSMHCATIADDSLEGVIQAVGRDPQNWSASGGWRLFSRELADHSRCFKASAGGVD
jgi:hypothetical protein